MMIKLFIALLLAFASHVAFAGSAASSGSAAGAEAGALSQSGVAIHSNAPAVDLSRSIGTAIAPALTTTLTETCMGSTSVGGGFMGGAFSAGTTWSDSECVNRLNARDVRALGDAQAAKEILCENSAVRKAFLAVGRPCKVDGGSYVVAANQVIYPVPQPNPSLSTIPAADRPYPLNLTDEEWATARKRSAALYGPGL